MTAIDRLRAGAGTADLSAANATDQDASGKNSKWTRRTLVMGGVAAAVVGIGVAEAAWTATASGNGASTAHATYSLSVAANSSATSPHQLYPGSGAGTPGDIELAITAPTQYGITVTGFSAGTGGFSSSAGTNCTGGRTGTHPTGLAYNFSANQAALGANSFNVAAGATVYVELSNAVAMDNTSDANCAGATFTVPVQVTATSLPGATTTAGYASSTAPAPTAVS